MRSGPAAFLIANTVGPEGCRMLFIFTPGGFEELIREMAHPAQTRTLPPPPDEDDLDFERVQAIAHKYGNELIA